MLRLRPPTCRLIALLGLFLTAASGPAFAQTLFVSDNWSPAESNFYTFDAASGVFLAEAFAPAVFTSPNIRGVAFDGCGNLLMADQTRLRKRAPDGTLSVFAEDAGLSFLDVAVGPDGIIWATYSEQTQPKAGGLRKFAADGTQLGDFRNWPHETASNVKPRSLVVGPDGLVYVTDRTKPGSSVAGAVVRFDPAAGSFATFNTSVPAPIGLAFHSDRDLLVVSDVTFSVEKLDGAGGAPVATFISPMPGFEPAGIIYVNDRLYVADRDFEQAGVSNGNVLVFDNTGALMFTCTPPPDDMRYSPIDLAIDSASGFSSFVPGDMNCDGALNGLDVAPFVRAVLDAAQFCAEWPFCSVYDADVNQDASVDTFDIAPFIALLTG